MVILWRWYTYLFLLFVCFTIIGNKNNIEQVLHTAATNRSLTVDQPALDRNVLHCTTTRHDPRTCLVPPSTPAGAHLCPSLWSLQELLDTTTALPPRDCPSADGGRFLWQSQSCHRLSPGQWGSCTVEGKWRVCLRRISLGHCRTLMHLIKGKQ